MSLEPSDLTEVRINAPRSMKPSASPSTPLRRLTLLTLGLSILFSPALYELARLSFRNDLHSHILLVPFISLYLAWLKKDRISNQPAPAWWPAGIFTALGSALVAGYWTALGSGWEPVGHDGLSLLIAAFVLFVWSASAIAMGSSTLRLMFFPLAFLLFMVPFPAKAESGIEHFLQHGSAEVSYLLLKMIGTPVLRDGTQFMLPNITLNVAPECSGIRSSLVLFITALLAGHFFLRKAWTQLTLAASVIILGIIRNAVRIVILAELCVHVDPDFIHSALHRRGGPIFFAVSLLPFFLLVWLLRKAERASRTRQPGPE